MLNINELLGAMMQSGMTRSADRRIEHALRSGGNRPEDFLSGILGGSGGGLGGALSGMLGGGDSGGGLGGTLGAILSDAGRALGGNRNMALGGLGALAGALLGGGRGASKGALGGGLMALLGALAFSALKKAGNQKPAVPVGLMEPATPQEENELEQETGLVVKAMINAAKSDNQIDEEELHRIVGKLEEMGVGSEEKEFLLRQLRTPMDTEALIGAAAGRPELAAQLYAASLLAIEVDTPAERDYLERFRSDLGLPRQAAEHIEDAVGMHSVG